MAVDNAQVVDFVALIDAEPTLVMLIIVDHLPWDEDIEGTHLEVLQAKINAYLAYIESGQLLREFPNTVGRKEVIKIIANYPLSEQGQKLFDLCVPLIRKAGFDLVFERAKLIH